MELNFLMQFQLEILLNQFGDAELAAMILPRNLVIEAADFPEVHIPAGTGGAAPAKLVTPPFNQIKAEVKRALSITKDLSLIHI